MTRATAAPLFLGMLLLACASPTHTVSPYDADAAEAEDLAWMARGICRMQRPELPPKPFRSDGCSSFPDGDWVECCVIHDMAYWCGGDAEARIRADEQLGACVAATGRPTLGSLMAFGVRPGGVPWMPFPWRWGYGWDFPEGYTDSAAPSPSPEPSQETAPPEVTEGDTP